MVSLSQLVLIILSFFLPILLQVAEGNIDDFDCVDIYKQPAFQHPLLKHHKIQKTFSTGQQSLHSNNKHKTNGQSCPKGTVPVLKQRNGTESFFHLDTVDYPGQHFAAMETVGDGTIYRGAEADITIHDVNVQRNQYSKSQIWLENGPRDQLNSIQVGWAVHPRVYEDSSTRFTIYWTADGYKKTGCYNTLCPGFVIVTQNPSIGKIFSKSSVYGGKETVLFTPQIFQDGFTGNWALKVDGEVIGYWPKEIFTHLNQGASFVRFGGNTFVSPDGISPPMGNGHLPTPDLQKSASILHMKVKDDKYRKIDVVEKKMTSNVDSQCFKLEYWGYNNVNGVAFSFGGPGGKCGV